MTLKEYMILKSLTCRDLAKLWNVSHTTVWYWATGKVTPTPTHARLIAKKTNGAVEI